MKASIVSICLLLLIPWQISAADIDLNTFLTQFQNCKILVYTFGVELTDNAVLSSLVSLQSPYNIVRYDKYMTSSDWGSIRDTCRVYIFNFNDQFPSHLMEYSKSSIASRNGLKGEDETDVNLIMLPGPKKASSIHQQYAFILDYLLWNWNVLGISLDVKSPDRSNVREITYLRWDCWHYMCWEDVKYDTSLSSIMQINKLMLKRRKDMNGFEISVHYPGFLESGVTVSELSSLNLRELLMRARTAPEIIIPKFTLELAAYLNFTARFESVGAVGSAIWPGQGFSVSLLNTDFFIRIIPTDMALLYLLYCKNATAFKYENGFLAWTKPLDAICWTLLLSTIGLFTIICSASAQHLISIKQWTLKNSKSLIQVGCRTCLNLIGCIIGQGGNFKKCKGLLLLWVAFSLLISINYGAFYKSNFIVGEEIGKIDTYRDLAKKGYTAVFQSTGNFYLGYQPLQIYNKTIVRNSKSKLDYEFYEEKMGYLFLDYVFRASTNKYIISFKLQIESIANAWVKAHENIVAGRYLPMSVCHIGKQDLFFGMEGWRFRRPNSAVPARAFSEMVMFGFQKLQSSFSDQLWKEQDVLEYKILAKTLSKYESENENPSSNPSESFWRLLLYGLGISTVLFLMEMLVGFIVPKLQAVAWRLPKIKLQCTVNCEC